MKKDSSYGLFYDLEIDSLADEINSKKYELVLLQFPDGLKQYAKEVVDELCEKTGAEFFIYFGTCYGACDLPVHLEILNFDLVVQWGHSEFVKTKEMW